MAAFSSALVVVLVVLGMELPAPAIVFPQETVNPFAAEHIGVTYHSEKPDGFPRAAIVTHKDLFRVFISKNFRMSGAIETLRLASTTGQYAWQGIKQRKVEPKRGRFGVWPLAHANAGANLSHYRRSFAVVDKSERDLEGMFGVDAFPILSVFNDVSYPARNVVSHDFDEYARTFGTKCRIGRFFGGISANARGYIGTSQKPDLNGPKSCSDKRGAEQCGSEQSERPSVVGQSLFIRFLPAFVGGAFCSIMFWLAVWAWNSPAEEDRKSDSEKGRK